MRKKGENKKEKELGLKLLGCYVIELYLDIYLTNSACIGLCVLGFRPEHSMYFVLDHLRKGTLQVHCKYLPQKK